MSSSPIDLLDEQTFLLIRLPKQTFEKAKNSETNSAKVGSVFIYDDGQAEFQDADSLKVYKLMRNEAVKNESTPTKTNKSSLNIHNNLVSSEESDLIKISLQKDEAIHLGKIKSSILFAVPKADEKDASTVF